MKIVILDGYTTNPGDVSWAPFKAFGEVEAYEYTSGDEVVDRCRGNEIIISNKTAFARELLEKLEGVKYIGLISTGYNVVDVSAAAELGITVTYVPTYGTQAVAQHTFALLLELVNHVGEHSKAIHEGRWSDHRRFCFWTAPLSELSGKTFGIIGFGRIGREAAKIAKAFGMKVIFYSHHETGEKGQVDLDTVFRESDVLSLHCPLNDETKEIINRENLSKMKSTSLIINTSRGGVVREDDLADALNNGIISGAGLDVMAAEPPTPDCALLAAKNCIRTPHIAWAAKETRERLIGLAADNLAAYLNGRPINIAK